MAGYNARRSVFKHQSSGEVIDSRRDRLESRDLDVDPNLAWL